MRAGYRHESSPASVGVWKRSDRSLGRSDDQLEATMLRLITISTVALVAVAMAFASRAEAGASASAPSKYARAHQQAASNYAITEYSSSSSRHRAARCTTKSYC